MGRGRGKEEWEVSGPDRRHWGKAHSRECWAAAQMTWDAGLVLYLGDQGRSISGTVPVWGSCRGAGGDWNSCENVRHGTS